MNKKQHLKTFDKAWQTWESEGGVDELVALFQGHDWLEVTASHQKGCDYGAIEINGSWACSYQQDGSWEATGKCLSALEEEFTEYRLFYNLPTGYELQLFLEDSIIGPTALYCAMAAVYVHQMSKKVQG